MYRHRDSNKVNVVFKEKGKKAEKVVELTELIDVKGWRAIGNKFVIQGPITRFEVEEEESNETSPSEEVKETEEKPADFLEQLKTEVKSEVEKEDQQLGLFGKNGKEDQ